MNIPTVPWKTFKLIEKEIGPIIEDVVAESCCRAIREERELTISNVDKVEVLL